MSELSGRSSSVIDPARTALLVMDCQRLIVEGYAKNPELFLRGSAAVIAAARKAGIKVIFITVGFREGFPEISGNNLIFSGVRKAGILVRGQHAAEIPEAIAPAAHDVVIEKHRVGSFEGTDLAVVLRAADVRTLVMFGIATSGVVLSTVRQASDLDYELIVLEDLCSDKDDEVHGVLVRKVFPSQARVVSSSEFTAEILAS